MSVQPPHAVWELLLCDAQPRGHIADGGAVRHRVGKLCGASVAVCFLRPLSCHSDVGVLHRSQVQLQGQPLHVNSKQDAQ